MRATAFYAATTLAVVALGGWLLGLHYASPAERRAVWTSAASAAGAALCMAAVGVLGFSARSLGLPLEAALVSLASFLFVTEIIEPLLLRV